MVSFARSIRLIDQRRFVALSIRDFTQMGSSNSKAPKAPQITPKDRAILDLKVQRDKLRQYQKQLERVQDRETELAREAMKRGDKRLALLALKKKKYQETLLEKTDGQMILLEQLVGSKVMSPFASLTSLSRLQVSSIEFALIETKVVQGLRSGTEVLKQLNRETRIEDVERLMDDTADAIAYQNEISEMLSGQMNEVDLEEIEEELEALVRAEEEEKAKVVTGKLPEVPTAELPRIEEKEKGGIRVSLLVITRFS